MLKVAPPEHSPVSARFHCVGDARIFAARSTRSASHRPTSALVVGAGAGSVVCDSTAPAANPTLARLASRNMRVYVCIGLSPLGCLWVAHPSWFQGWSLYLLSPAVSHRS